MKFMSKMKFGLVAALAAFGLTAGTAFATSEDCFTFENGVITGYSGWDWNVEIPATIGGEPVVAIGDRAFQYLSFGNLIVPASVKDIGESAFNGCGSMNSITFAAGSALTNIADNAFSECTGLERIEIPEHVERIGNSAFYSCSRLARVVFSGTAAATHIDDGAFTGVSSCLILPAEWPAEDFPRSDVSWHGGHFVVVSGSGSPEDPWTISGTELRISTNGVDTLILDGQGAVEMKVWGDCPPETIACVRVGKGVTAIGDGLFFYDSIITGVVIEAESELTSIGSGAFQYCSRLQAISLENAEKLNTIGDSAFNSCYELMRVVIPASVTGIGYQAFSYSYKVSCVEILGTAVADGINSYAFDGVGNSDSHCILILPSDWTGTVPDYYGNWFGGYFDLIEGKGSQDDPWIAGENVTAYTNGAGRLVVDGAGAVSKTPWVTSAESITELYATKDVIDLGNAPKSLPNLKHVSFAADSTMTRISSFEFHGSALESIDIPASVTVIEDEAFSGCANLKHVNFAENSQLTRIGVTEWEAKAMNSTWVFSGSGLESIVIPASVQFLGGDAFSRCDSLTNVTFEAGSRLEVIDGEAFYMSAGLRSIEIPASVTEIRSFAFGYTSLSNITFAADSHLEDIDQLAFAWTPLKSIVLPESLGNIGVEAFVDCLNLTNVTFTSAKAAGHIMDGFYGGVFQNVGTVVPCTLELPSDWPDTDKPNGLGEWHGGVFVNYVLPGSFRNPWPAGDGVTAFTNGMGGLVVNGPGSVAFDDPPWGAVAGDIREVQLSADVTDVGKTFTTLPNLQKVNGLPLPVLNQVIAAVIQPAEVKAFTVNPVTMKGLVTIGVMKSATEKDPQWTQGETVDVEIAVPSKVGVLKLVTGVEKTEEKCEE